MIGIEQELLKRERSFSTFRDLKVLIVSWNVDAAKPEALTGDPENLRFLHNVLTSVDSPDIISFGFQEVIDLESRKMAAKTVLLGGKKKGDEGKINEKVTSSYKKWHDRLILAVKLAMPPESSYTVIHTESLVGLFTCMFIKNAERAFIRDVAIATIKRGMGGRYGNKVGLLLYLVISTDDVLFFRVASSRDSLLTIRVCVSLIATWLLDNIMSASATRTWQLFSKKPTCSLRNLSKMSLDTLVEEMGRWSSTMKLFLCVHDFDLRPPETLTEQRSV